MANGIYKADELIDSMIIDVNDGLKNLINGQYIVFAGAMNNIASKLLALKKGIADDLAHKNETIEQLKEQLRRSGVELTDIPIDQLVKEGTDNGKN